VLAWRISSGIGNVHFRSLLQNSTSDQGAKRVIACSRQRTVVPQ
jgi:hypothetical protein